MAEPIKISPKVSGFDPKATPLPDNKILQAALNGNREAANCLFAPQPEGIVERSEYGLFVSSANSFPLFNGIYPSADCKNNVQWELWFANCIQRLRARQTPGICWISDEVKRSEALTQRLQNLGVTPQGEMQDFAVDVAHLLRKKTESEPVGFSMVRIEGLKDLVTWNQIVCSCFDLPEFAAEHFYQVFASALTRGSENLQNFLVKMNDEPIGTGSLFFTNNFAGVYNIAIHPKWRNQDFAQALLLGLAKRIKDRGYLYAGGSAFDSVMPLYRKADLFLLGRQNLYLI